MDACVLLDVSEIYGCGVCGAKVYLSHCFPAERAEAGEPIRASSGIHVPRRPLGGCLQAGVTQRADEPRAFLPLWPPLMLIGTGNRHFGEISDI